jgi:hypothetical protein
MDAVKLHFQQAFSEVFGAEMRWFYLQSSI